MPIIHYSDGSTQLYSGDLTDVAPFMIIKHQAGKVVFQVLDSGALELPPYLALELSIDIQNIVFAALKHDQCNHKWQTRYITIDNVDCATGMRCVKCDARLSLDELEDLLNK